VKVGLAAFESFSDEFDLCRPRPVRWSPKRRHSRNSERLRPFWNCVLISGIGHSLASIRCST